MSDVPPPLRLLAIAGADERPAMLSAARQVAAAVGAAMGREWTLRLAFADAPGEAAEVVIVSLHPELGTAEPLRAVAARWQRDVATFAAGGVRVVVPTLYRHVPDVADPALRALRVERIRRLNALAIALSRAHGCGVADVDRAFAMLGSAVLAGGAGDRVALVAGHVIAAAILAADLAPCLPPDVQDGARTAHGGLGAFVDAQRWPA